MTILQSPFLHKVQGHDIKNTRVLKFYISEATNILNLKKAPLHVQIKQCLLNTNNAQTQGKYDINRIE